MIGQSSLYYSQKKTEGAVECLGIRFDNDNERREYFIDKLREKLKDPTFRKTEGFPIGSDEDILALSDPPYYTACPNPFLSDFIDSQSINPLIRARHHSNIEPYASDISGSKSTKIYMAHTYHTKVPPESIAPLIEHYTIPGDIILDPFCGSGMTGVATHIVNSKNSVPRKCILSDLSPFASFLSDRMNHSTGAIEFLSASDDVLNNLYTEIGWIYKRLNKQEISYAIWSDLLICPNCGNNQDDWSLTVDDEKITTKEPICIGCHSKLKRSEFQRAKYSFYDDLLKVVRTQSKQVISKLAIKTGNKIKLVSPEDYDFEIYDRIKKLITSLDIPIAQLPTGLNTQQPINSHGFNYAHDFYTDRNMYFISKYIEKSNGYSSKRDLLFLLTSVLVKTASRLHSIGFGGSINLAGQSPNTLQIPSTGAERNMFSLMRGKIKDLSPIYEYKKSIDDVIVNTGCAQNLFQIPDSSIDYIFTDPPFGANINYSEVSYLYEAWLRVFTNINQEAIVNKFQNKDVFDYERLMRESLKECYRVLKPGRWITVEFHNSSSAIWNAIQNAIGEAGFVIADVRIFDKGQGTWKQMTTSGSVKNDLMISAYKPITEIDNIVTLSAGSENGVWDFVRSHLKKLPTFIDRKEKAEVIAERLNYLLYDRMIAFHVQRGTSVPMSAAEFYVGLDQKFSSRDNMYFTADQVAEYDKKRANYTAVEQLELFVSDESTAINWLKQQITSKPQTLQDLHPYFVQRMNESGGWRKQEKLLELSELLKQNFLRYDGISDLPSQIHSYLSTNFKDCRNLPKESSQLKSKAKDRWYVPDPNKAQDLEKLREKSLIKEFDEYIAFSGRKLKTFRLEAIRTGFKKAWGDKDYQTIINVAKKVPDDALQEDPKLIMWYDGAMTRMGD